MFRTILATTRFAKNLFSPIQKDKLITFKAGLNNINYEKKQHLYTTPTTTTTLYESALDTDKDNTELQPHHFAKYKMPPFM